MISLRILHRTIFILIFLCIASSKTQANQLIMLINENNDIEIGTLFLKNPYKICLTKIWPASRSQGEGRGTIHRSPDRARLTIKLMGRSLHQSHKLIYFKFLTWPASRSSLSVGWWRRWELNPCPQRPQRQVLHAQSSNIPLTHLEDTDRVKGPFVYDYATLD